MHIYCRIFPLEDVKFIYFAKCKLKWNKLVANKNEVLSDSVEYDEFSLLKAPVFLKCLCVSLLAPFPTSSPLKETKIRSSLHPLVHIKVNQWQRVAQ